jgi:hypothetical protein
MKLLAVGYRLWAVIVSQKPAAKSQKPTSIPTQTKIFLER